MALPIGCDREMSKMQFGLYKFPLVAVVTCVCRLVGMSVDNSADTLAELLVIAVARYSG